MTPAAFGDLKEMDLYLAIPLHQPGQMSVSLTGSNMNTRYVAHLEEDVKDEITGRNPKAIQVARKNFRVLLETQREELKGCSAMRVARIIRQGERAFRVDEKAPPPLLRPQSSVYLTDIFRGLINALVARAGELTKGLRPKGETRELTALDTFTFWLLHTLNTSIPVLREFCDAEPRGSGGIENRGAAEAGLMETSVHGVHPVHLFRELSSLAGALLAFRLNDEKIPAYDHDNPGACFGELTRLIRRLVAEAIPKTYDSRLLRARPDPNQFFTPVPDEWFRLETSWYLAVTSALNDSEWKDVLPTLEANMKVASVNEISERVKTSTVGVKFSFDSTPSAALPTKTARHFQLTTDGAFWERVQRTRSLAVYVPKEVKAISVELVVLLPPEAMGGAGKR
jgi:type VI secretion system protein ImpJ